MKKFFKYALLTIGVVVLLLAGIAIYLAATFDPNAYKAQIIKVVKDSTQRTLRLDGNIKLTFFPSLGVSVGKVSLSELGNEQTFAAIDNAHIALALLPLLSKQVVVDQVVVDGVTVHLIRHKDGKFNFDDLLAPGSSTPAAPASKPAQAAGIPIKFNVASVNMDNIALDYRDEASGAQYAVKGLRLDTGRIANGVPTRIALATSVQSSQPKLDLAVKLQTDLTFDLDKPAFQLSNFDLLVKGNVLNINNLLVKAGGDISAKPRAGEFSVNKFSFAASGAQGGNNFNAKLDLPRLMLANDKLSGDQLTLDASLDMDQPKQDFAVKLSSLLDGNLDTRQFGLSRLTLALKATGDNLPGKSVSSEMKGNVKLDLKNQNAALNLAGGLLQSQVKADAAVSNFSSPAIRFNVDIDQFDVDPYLPKTSKDEARARQPTAPEQPFDLSALKELNLDGNLHVGALKAFNVKVQQLRVGIKARNGEINVAPLSARLYQGSMDGSASANARSYVFTVRENLAGVEVEPLIKDALNLDLVQGKGNIALNLDTHGNTVSGLKQALNGTAALNLENGAIKGINLNKLAENLGSLGKNTTAQTLGVDKNEKTDFSEFKASFKVHNGVAHNDNLSVRSTVLRITGNGDINIGRSNMDYNAKATFAKTEHSSTATLPVQISGPFDNLKIKVDYAALLADVAREQLNEQKKALVNKAREDAKKQLEQKLKGGLQNLLK